MIHITNLIALFLVHLFFLPCENNKALSDEKGFYLDPSPKTRPEKRKLNDFSFLFFFIRITRVEYGVPFRICYFVMVFVRMIV